MAHGFSTAVADTSGIWLKRDDYKGLDQVRCRLIPVLDQETNEMHPVVEQGIGLGWRGTRPDGSPTFTEVIIAVKGTDRNGDFGVVQQVDPAELHNIILPDSCTLASKGERKDVNRTLLYVYPDPRRGIKGGAFIWNISATVLNRIKAVANPQLGLNFDLAITFEKSNTIIEPARDYTRDPNGVLMSGPFDASASAAINLRLQDLLDKFKMEVKSPSEIAQDLGATYIGGGARRGPAGVPQGASAYGAPPAGYSPPTNPQRQQGGGYGAPPTAQSYGAGTSQSSTGVAHDDVFTNKPSIAQDDEE